MPVPGKDPCALVAVGSWSILSTADVVNTPMFSVGGQTVPIVSKWLMAVLPRSADNPRTRSYETDNPSLYSVSTRSFDLVLECTNATRNNGSGVSLRSECLVCEHG